jgi:DNA polymerase III subunit gamma/tau
MSAQYIVIARRYRPQTFAQIIGQEAIVRTVQRAIVSNTTSHAYIFSGQRGTGKTTFARLCAKALNCEHLSSDGEPCNACTSCREISESRSVDVQEIDGASNRGIDHIRSLTQSTCYVPATSRFKIYIIDEVHMLTKEAFNALLKTLEEPPPLVKFLLATTEMHKIPATIQSRCQRFQLKRLTCEHIVNKLQRIVQDMSISADPEALVRLATYADGGLRDAESLLDQLISFSDGHISCDMLTEVLGLMPKTFFIDLNKAIQTSDLQAAYTLSDAIFYQGKDVGHCMDDICAHARNLLLFKLGSSQSLISTTATEDAIFRTTASLLSKEQFIELFNILAEAQRDIKTASSQRFLLEMLLINIVTISRKVPLPFIAKKLSELEKTLGTSSPIPEPCVQIEKKVSKKLENTKEPLVPPKTAIMPSEENIVAQKTSTQIRNAPLADLPIEQEQARLENLVHFAATELNATMHNTNAQ